MDSQNPFYEFFSKSEIPKMPEGYYSGDKPNPNLRAFVEQHIKERPYDPETDDYDVPAFDKPIETTKATAIYNMHTNWSKKPHDAIRQYIRHYTNPGDLVLDPFCGSGGTALAALMEGRKAIAIDRSPAATFITKNYCTPVDVDELQKALEELKAKVKPEIDWLYETRCDRCGGKAGELRSQAEQKIIGPSGQLDLQIVLVPYGVMLFEIFPVEVAEAERPREDINADGQVNILDVVSLMLLGIKNPADPRADYDSSGTYSVQDAVLLAQNIYNRNHSVVTPPLSQSVGPHYAQMGALN